MTLLGFALALGSIGLFAETSFIATDLIYSNFAKRIIEEGFDGMTAEEIATYKYQFKQEMANVLKKRLADDKNVPKVRKITTTEMGFLTKIDISNITTFKAVADEEDYFKQAFRAHEVDITNYRGYAYVYCVLKELNQMYAPKLELKPLELCFGYDPYGDPIIIDMDVTPHMGIVGLSKSGKSTAIENALSMKSFIDITLINCFDKDFKRLGDAPRIRGNKEILDYLQNILEEGYRQRPLFIVIDEYNILSNVAKVDKAIQDLLSQARHYNVFVICIMQLGNKEDCKFKNLFNCRVVFRTIDDATIKAFLGCSTSYKALDNYKFLIYHSKLQKGTAYRALVE